MNRYKHKLNGNYIFAIRVGVDLRKEVKRMPNEMKEAWRIGQIVFKNKENGSLILNDIIHGKIKVNPGDYVYFYKREPDRIKAMGSGMFHLVFQIA